MASSKYDSNCTLGERCQTHGNLRELEKSLVRLGPEETLELGPCDSKTCIEKLINGGAFGQIYLGKLKATGKMVAVKLENQGNGHEKLLFEGSVYRKLEKCPGIPHMEWYGMHGSMYNVLVMDLLGPSLNNLFDDRGKHFSLKTVLLLIDQIINIFEHVHKQGFIHQDISPSNFVIGGGSYDRHQVYLIDFGLAKRVNQPGMFMVSSRSTSFNRAKSVVGTPRYSSIHSHHGDDLMYGDDMEALGYMWVYFLKGSLPWQGVKAESHMDKLCKIGHLKESLDGRKICKGLPDEFALYIDYCRNLKHSNIPNYSAMARMFQDLAKKKGVVYDYQFDWLDTEHEEDYYGKRVRCESISSPKSLRTHKKLRIDVLPKRFADEEIGDISD